MRALEQKRTVPRPNSYNAKRPAVSCLCSGCVHSQAEATSKTAAKPHNPAVVGHQTATFNVVANTNGGPLSYHWYFNGANTSGVTNR